MTKDWFTRLFWTFDMVASCLTGFVFSDGAFDTISIIVCYCFLLLRTEERILLSLEAALKLWNALGFGPWAL